MRPKSILEFSEVRVKRQENTLAFTLGIERIPCFDCLEFFSAKNPPPLCQGICPYSCICVKYYNMTYGGDDKKWGGCLEIYGDVLIQILDIKFGCFYLPVSQEQRKTINNPIHSLLNYLGFSDDIFNDMQQWFQTTFGNKMSKRHHKKKNPLNFLFKNRVEDDNENI